jgi:methylglyoxal synthase
MSSPPGSSGEAAFAASYRDKLTDYRIIATAATGRLLREGVGPEVEDYLSGPLGGDVQIAARIASREVAAVVFLVDPLDKHPHDPDIQAVQRVCNVLDVPLATNVATANLTISADAV